MLNHPSIHPNEPILNRYPLNLQLIHKYQQLDQPLMKAVQDDKKFKNIHIYGNHLITYQPLRSMRQCTVEPQRLQYPAVRWMQRSPRTCWGHKII